ncbi:MAG: hypothetical protein JKP97_06250 [Rhodobacteraceae bacterium]|jgi:hypothetical protein|nr:hypothetical protein [Paracoccaceae bacterium]
MTLADHLDVQDSGNIVTLRPISDPAREWVCKNVGQPAPGGVWHVEPRFAGPIVEGMAADLLRWH